MNQFIILTQIYDAYEMKGECGRVIINLSRVNYVSKSQSNANTLIFIHGKSNAIAVMETVDEIMASIKG